MDSSQSDHILTQTWPHFLDLLNSDPVAAGDDFARFAYTLLQLHPPRVFGSLTQEQRDDYVQDIIMHFLKGDAAVLRQYTNRGLPFSSWFTVVATRKAFDILRRDVKRQTTEASFEDSRDYSLMDTETTPADERYGYREVLDRAADCLRQMSSKCRILLQAAAEGYEPKELVALLPSELRDNKHASDSLRACRKRLRALLTESGVDPSHYFSDRVKE